MHLGNGMRFSWETNNPSSDYQSARLESQWPRGMWKERKLVIGRLSEQRQLMGLPAETMQLIEFLGEQRFGSC